MANPKPTSLSDHELSLEITSASRRLHAARTDFQNQRYNISDDGWEALQRAVFDAEKYLRTCLCERSRRETAASFHPKPPAHQRTLVKKAPPVASNAEAPAPKSDWDEPKGPPIIVFDETGPRRWRKGDPIY